MPKNRPPVWRNANFRTQNRCTSVLCSIRSRDRPCWPLMVREHDFPSYRTRKLPHATNGRKTLSARRGSGCCRICNYVRFDPRARHGSGPVRGWKCKQCFLHCREPVSTTIRRRLTDPVPGKVRVQTIESDRPGRRFSTRQCIGLLDPSFVGSLEMAFPPHRKCAL